MGCCSLFSRANDLTDCWSTSINKQKSKGERGTWHSVENNCSLGRGRDNELGLDSILDLLDCMAEEVPNIIHEPYGDALLQGGAQLCLVQSRNNRAGTGSRDAGAGGGTGRNCLHRLLTLAIREDNEPTRWEGERGVASTVHDLMHGLLINWSISHEHAGCVSICLLQDQLVVLVGGSIIDL